MNDVKDIVDRLDFIGLSSCYECGGNHIEYRLIQKAIKEIKSLRLEVERLRRAAEYWEQEAQAHSDEVNRLS
jgi:hypothetical protein